MAVLACGQCTTTLLQHQFITKFAHGGHRFKNGAKRDNFTVGQVHFDIKCRGQNVQCHPNGATVSATKEMHKNKGFFAYSQPNSMPDFVSVRSILPLGFRNIKP